MKSPTLTLSASKALVTLLLSMLLMALIATIIMAVIGRGGVTRLSLQISTVIQDVLVFIVPAILTAILASRAPARLLCVDRGASPLLYVAAIAVMMASIPAMNTLVEWNESLRLPESMDRFQQWMLDSEERARGMVEIMLGGDSVGSLIVNILIVGVLAGVSEELLFRGCLQRILGSTGLGTHTAIWLTALVFSAFHLQFLGFFPRFVLGAYFGYLLLWSGSVWLPATIHALNNSIVVWATWRQASLPDSVSGATIDNFGAGSWIWTTLSLLVVAGGLWYTRHIARETQA